MVVETCKYIRNNGIEDFRLVANFPEHSRRMEEQLRDNGITFSRPGRSQSSSSELGPNSTTVTVVALFCAFGTRHQKKMADLLRNAINASK